MYCLGILVSKISLDCETMAAVDRRIHESTGLQIMYCQKWCFAHEHLVTYHHAPRESGVEDGYTPLAIQLETTAYY